MKNLLFITLLCLASLRLISQCPDNCDNVLLLGYNSLDIYTQNELNSAYAEMLSKSDEELNIIERNSSSGQSASGKYKFISGNWSKNKNDSEWRMRFNEARELYQKSGTLATSFIYLSSQKIVNETTILNWQKCKSDLFDCIVKTNPNSANPKSFTTEINGDPASDFTLIVHFKPQNREENKPVKIESFSYSQDLVPRNPVNFNKGAIINPYSGLSQSFVRINKDKPLSITLILDGQSPISVNLPPEKSFISGIPVGTITASTFNYSELCGLLKEPSTFSTNNTWAPADGRAVVGSKYGELRNSVPDLRGVFLRGLNSFYPDNNGAAELIEGQIINEDSKRIAGGNFQHDATRMPYNKFVTAKDGTHVHGFSGDPREMSGDGAPYTNNIDSGSNDTRSADRNYIPSGTITTTGSEHTHVISGGDQETRPKNVVVYYYIKIN